jgi:Acyl-CoA carboxylase epsilon subunit
VSDEIRILRGVPTDEELAAIVGVLMLRRVVVAVPRQPSVSRWASSGRPGYARPDGRPTQLGPNAWRRSALPH